MTSPLRNGSRVAGAAALGAAALGLAPAGAALLGLARSVALTRDPSRQDRQEAPERVPAERTEHRIPGPHGELHVVEWGSGRPILLVHGYTSTYGDWLPVVPGLLEAGHRVLAMDLPGHGESAGGRSGPITPDRLADAVRAVLEHFDLRDAVLCGHSLGGMAVLALASRDRDVVTERVRHLVTVGGPPMIRRPAEVVTITSGANPFTPALLHLELTGRPLMRLQAFGPDVDADVVDSVRKRWARCPLRTRWAVTRGVLGRDLRPQLGGVPVPLTAVVGSLDRMVPPSRARMIADRVPHAQVRVLDGAGHVLPRERTEEITEVLLQAAA
jgi:non-heme chloroperoxidase